MNSYYNLFIIINFNRFLHIFQYKSNQWTIFNEQRKNKTYFPIFPSRKSFFQPVLAFEARVDAFEIDLFITGAVGIAAASNCTALFFSPPRHHHHHHHYYHHHRHTPHSPWEVRVPFSPSSNGGVDVAQFTLHATYDDWPF